MFQIRNWPGHQSAREKSLPVMSINVGENSKFDDTVHGGYFQSEFRSGEDGTCLDSYGKNTYFRDDFIWPLYDFYLCFPQTYIANL